LAASGGRAGVAAPRSAVVQPGWRAAVLIWCSALIAACGSGSAATTSGEETLSTVATVSGELTGTCRDGICEYLGIPYAFAPLGNRRWQQPLSYGASEALLADEFGDPCPQLAPDGKVSGSEDCLTLNLWVPETAESLATLVFLHGGGNVSDSASNPRYDGRRLAKRAGIIVASIEFRLGALGYLVHPALGAENAAGVSGNYGLLDQVTALQWLRENLYGFGSNGRITLMGQSAGARNLCALLASPTPLLWGVQGVILQSGACNARDNAESVAHGQHLAATLGCNSARDVAACLRRQTAHDVTRVVPGLPDIMTTSPYNAHVDGWLVDMPLLEGLSSGRNGHIALWVGSNSQEVAHVVPDIDSDEEYRTLTRSYFGEELVDTIVARYPSSGFASPRAALIAAITDARYTCAMRQTLRARLAGGADRVYRYVFAHRPEREPYRTDGAIHGLERMYLFQNFGAYDYTPAARDLEVADAMADLYGEFVRQGTLDAEGPLSWPTYSLASPRYGSFGKEETPDRADSHCEFWDGLGTGSE